MDLEIYDDTKNVPEEKIKLIEDVLNVFCYLVSP